MQAPLWLFDENWSGGRAACINERGMQGLCRAGSGAAIELNGPNAVWDDERTNPLKGGGNHGLLMS